MFARHRALRPCATAAACDRDAASRAVHLCFRLAILSGALVSTLLAAAGVDARGKIDVVKLVNGDRITGEIKQLDLGILTVSTDHVGTVSVEWVAVVSVESTQLFEVILSDGGQLVGTFDPGPVSGKLEVSRPEGGTAILEYDRIVQIGQLGRTMWRRWRGDINLGASFASANNQRDLTLDAEATFQGERLRLRNTLSGAISDRDDATRTSWGTFATNFQRYLSNRWFWYAQLQFDRNEELDLELRTTISGGGGRYLVTTPKSQLYTSAGISAVREVYTPEESGDWSSELALIGDYELFLFSGRETSLTTSLSFLPSLSVSGRYRLQYSASFRRKLILALLDQ